MFTFIVYELKVAVILAVFYLSFKCLLSRDNLHRLNRVVLVATSLLSFIIPLCVITVHRTLSMPEDVASGLEVVDDAVAVAAASAAGSSVALETVVVAFYWIGVAAVLCGIAAGIVRVIRLIRSGEKMQMGGSEVVVCDGSIPPFSWMKWIVMSRADFESGNRHILEHEKAHVRLGHSKDVLLVDVLTAFQWFNPAIWLLKSDLRAVHEYEADDAVLSQGVNIKEYQYSLIRKAVSGSGYSITNSFNHSILKNRITMMSKQKASATCGLKALYVVPLLCGALALNARTVYSYEVSEINSLQQKPIKVEATAENGKVIYLVNGEKMPLEKVGEKVAVLRKDNEFAVVEMVLSGNLKVADVVDLKEELRKINELKLNVDYVQVTAQDSPEKASAKEDSVPFQMVDVKPSFNGGDANEFSKWVNANLRYPADAKAEKVQGRVVVTFDVKEDGKVGNVKVLRGVQGYPSLEAEAVRVISESPAWKPGEKEGKKVPVTYTFPVTFSLK